MMTYLDLGHDDLEATTSQWSPPRPTDFAVRTAQEILSEIMRFRRTPQTHQNCDTTCPACHSPHLDKIISAIRSGTAVTLVLPAFPGKSPNLSKVLGALPDMAEQLALQFLDQLCERIQAIYAPGARIILCSDGRVFSDVVGMLESDVTEYQDQLDTMIADLGLTNLSTFNLDELSDGRDFVIMRRELMEKFGAPQELLKEKVQRGAKPMSLPEDEEANRMYCGITRFLVEDSTFPGQTKTRTAIQKECKAKAYEVIRRSNAWSELISEQFPDAVRLSIHPQACGAKKLGIRLIGNESWMTPWHGVAVKVENEFVLLKRKEAEALGAQLVLSRDGRPSHFELPKDHSTATLSRDAEA
jgi:pyoverdine/dityrosine biosynthesis protein Dit1